MVKAGVHLSRLPTINDIFFYHFSLDILKVL